MLLMPLQKQPGRYKSISGICANCQTAVYESLATLDDVYAVWWGICPYCNAINGLDLTKGLRGYSSVGMDLTLPKNEEVVMNDMPPGTLTKGWDRPENKGKSKEELIKIYG